MRTADLQHIPELEHVPVLDAQDPLAVRIISPEQSLKFAEADTVIRARDLLCRNEYKLVAVVRFLTEEGESVRIYFAQTHHDDVPQDPS
ncbi:MAG: hypothetical protein KDA79_23500 [Planctomycetaceae bacterium]|nr:hypothetical protein [Planctomycetaceae bacterium]